MAEFSRVEMERRRDLVRARMRELELPFLLAYGTVGAHAELHWLADFQVTFEAALLLPLEGEPTLFVNHYNHLPDAIRQAGVRDVRWGGDEVVATAAREVRGAHRLGLAGPLPFNRVRPLPRAIVDLTPELAAMRLTRSEEELALIRRAATLSDAALGAVRSGRTELEIVAEMERGWTAQGARSGIHFLAATPMREPHLAVPAQVQSKRRVRRGDVVLTEISASVHGYWGQVQRTISIGDAPTADYARLHEAALEAFEGVRGVIREGAGSDAVLDAAEVIHERGFTICDDLLHIGGGGVYRPHLRTRRTTAGEPPRFSFRAGMAVVVQPNVITPDGRAGVQVGELLLVTPTGTERLHALPLELLRRD